ncbi:MAG: DUF4965 domain-containing protein [Candidatus Azobacteroides sp.]|nr:DUF4965 domain-containing protein [Candidatus Azobacteroides sp.]
MKCKYLYNFFIITILFLYSCNNTTNYEVTSRLRAPAYPLISIDPYTNAWSFGDKLYGQSVTHWTGKPFRLVGALRVNGSTYRFMGTDNVRTKPLAGMSSCGDWEGKYTFDTPASGWEQPGFNDSAWKTGFAAFGQVKYEEQIKTPWTTNDIWVRRSVMLEEDLAGKNIYLEYSHDDDVDIYINGIEVVNSGNQCANNVQLRLPDNVVKTLVKGRNIISAHCHNLLGDSYLDFGLNIEIPVSCDMMRNAEQKSVEVLPTQTIYTFVCGPVDLKLTFTAPLLMHNLDLLSRPVNYIGYEVRSNDSQLHSVEIYLEAGAQWALNLPSQETETEMFEKDDLLVLKTGSKSQDILGKSGDDLRIDWGYFYLAGSNKKNTSGAFGDNSLRTAFCETGSVGNDTLSTENHGVKTLALSRDLGRVKNPENGFFMIGYDDIYSIKYFGERLRPYWNRKGNKDIVSLLLTSSKEYEKIKKACNTFDMELMHKAERSGGKKYAELCALAYRQTISAHKLVEAPNGELLFLSKENNSRGAISTVDVSFPSAPLFLLYNVELAKGQLNPIFYYSEQGGWDQDFAPHDVGLYPIVNGQYSELNMPVEESANMLILTAAIATMEGNADYAGKHWNVLTRWAEYLEKKGLDPEKQRYTDAFAGFSEHNTNLSVKAIIALASYGRLADMLGKNQVSQKYSRLARSMAQKWMKMADDGDHYRLAFDQQGTWSQKYNLVWDKVMRMNIFPHEVAEKEIAFYLDQQKQYGLPLDSQHKYTKADWIVWSATLSPDMESFQRFIEPLYAFVNETVDRVPMSDWYWTDRPIHAGFQARPVVGGFFIKMMEDKLVSKIH